MPKRVLDGEAMWGSTKLSELPEWMVPEYSWLYPLADANGSFEITNLRIIWGKVAAIRPHLTLENLQEIMRAFHEHGVLFIWERDGKRYGHWTGSDKPGRLPRESRRTARYGPLLAPPVPAQQLRDFELRQQKCRTATAEASPVLVLDLVLEGVRGKEGAPESGAPAAQDKPGPSPSSFTGLHYTVSSRQDRVLADAFPWVDRQAEYHKADSWLEANPNRRPKNSSRFLHNWFGNIPAPSNGAKGGNRAEQRTVNNLRAAGFVQ
jgi:hypothetical protein